MGKLVFDIGTTTAIRNVGNVQAEKILAQVDTAVAAVRGCVAG